MQRKPFDHTGVELPVIGQGTWDIPESGAKLAEARRALRRGIELGMTHLDTAEMYGDGRVEEILGEAIQGIPRESLFVTSKVLPENATRRGIPAACERSLKRLKTDYLDLYLLHWPSAHSLEETMQALEQLVRDGKTRFVGVSNFDLEEMRDARGYLRDVPLSCNQVLYHLLGRGIEHRILPFAEQHGIAIVAYTPFGRGRFPRDSESNGNPLSRIARKHSATVRQVILAFLTRSPVAFTIPKASSIEHVEENSGAGELRLDAADIAEIDKAFPIGPDVPLAML